MANLQINALNQPLAAFDSFSAAFDIEPSYEGTLDSLETIAVQEGVLERFADVLERTAVKTAEAHTNADIGRRLGRLYQGVLSDNGQATHWWSKVSDFDEYDEEALAALDSLYNQTDDWPALMDVIRRRVENASEVDSLNLRCRLGRLTEVVEGNVGGAVELHRSVLWDDCKHRASRAELERLVGYLEHRSAITEVLSPIYLDEADWLKFAILTEMNLELSLSSAERSGLWLRAADVRLSHLNDRQNGFDNLVSALMEDPSNPDVRSRILNVGETDERWDALRDVFSGIANDHDDPEDCVADHLRVAAWSWTKLSDNDTAIKHYQAVLDFEPENSAALDALDELLTTQGDWDAVVQTKLQRIETVFEPELRKDLLIEVGRLVAEELGDGSRAVAIFEECLEIEESDTVVWEALETLYDGLQDWTSLYRLRELQLESSADVDDQLSRLRQMADLGIERLDNSDLARQAYERIIELHGGDTEARDGLRSLYQDLGYWSELRELLEDSCEWLESEDEKVGIYTELAELAETRLDQPDLAIDYLRQAARMQPHSVVLIDELERLLVAEENWYDLVEILKDHKDALADEGDDYWLGLSVRIGQLAAQKIMDFDLAIESLEAVVAVQPDRVDALETLADLHAQNYDWETVTTVLNQLLGHVDETQRSAVTLRLANVYREHLNDEAQAVGYYQDVFAETGAIEAIDALLDYYEREGDSEQVRILLQQKVDVADGDALSTALLKLGELVSAEGEHEPLIDALAAYADDLDFNGLSLLAGAYESLNDVTNAERILSKLAEKLDAARRYRDLLDCSFKLAVYAEQRGDIEHALHLYRKCHTFDATHLPTLQNLSELLVKGALWTDALPVLQAALLQQSKLDTKDRIQLFLQLGDTRDAMGDARKARDMYTRVLNIESENVIAKDALDRLAKMS